MSVQQVVAMYVTTSQDKTCSYMAARSLLKVNSFKKNLYHKYYIVAAMFKVNYITPLGKLILSCAFYHCIK